VCSFGVLLRCAAGCTDAERSWERVRSERALEREGGRENEIAVERDGGMGRPGVGDGAGRGDSSTGNSRVSSNRFALKDARRIANDTRRNELDSDFGKSR